MSLATEYPSTNDCMELQNQLEKLIVKKNFYATNFLTDELQQISPFIEDKKAKMKVLQCDKKNIATKGAMIDYYINKYSEVDRDRIEPDSIAQARKRIFVGGGILILALGVLFVATQKK
jgi:hypothetical protein